ncbi:MAG: hypothetical protein V1750_11785, partial [Acidobacteriota bacterium]
LRRLGEALLPVGPVALRAPRWVHEGYATYLEGKLTGAGRPNSDLRAALLRVKARAGQLPSYRQMSSDEQSWLGMSMAYVMGSAYFEWLVERAGPESPRRLWARLTARSDRNFKAAFEGVFSEVPEKLYDRFAAELTYRALEAERRLGPARREGELWQDQTWTTGEPSLSADGALLAIVLRAREQPSRLVVWSTAADEEGERKYRERVERTLRRDPLDVAPVASKPLARKPAHELVTRDGAEPASPRFMPDGKSVLFVRFEPDPEGFLHPDLFRWWPGDGKVDRITRLADVREADPAPDGTWAIAVRHRHGFSQLVRVDLGAGGVEAITEPSVENVFASPRISPDGQRLAYLRHQGGEWRLLERDLDSGTESELPAPAGATIAYPAWAPDGGKLYACVGQGGFIDVMAFSRDAIEAVTRTAGAAVAPAPTPDGAGLYFLSLEADGLDLRYLALAGGGAPAVASAKAAELAPAVRPLPPPSWPALEAAEVGAGRPYGLGRQELKVVMGGSTAPSGRAWEAGIRLGDPVGRLDLVALGGGGTGAGPGGGSLAVAWRGWPVEITAQLFATRERPSKQPVQVVGLGAALDLDRRGGALSARWRRTWRASQLRLTSGLLLESVETAGGEELAQRIVTLGGRFERTPSIGRWRFPHALDVRHDLGTTSGQDWRRWNGALELGVARRDSGLRLVWSRSSVRNAQATADRLQLGGLSSSLLPAAALAGRVRVAALPAGTALGDDYEGQHAAVTLGGLPLFFARHRLWVQGAGKGGWLSLAGLEWELTSDPLPLLRFPGFHLTLGAARILDEPFKGKTKGWVGVEWKP